MITRLLLMVVLLSFPFQSSVIQEIDLSGEWIDYNGRKWSLTQENDRILMVREDKWCRGGGKLEGREIKHKTYIQLSGSAPKGCENYMDVPLYFDAKFVLSDDGNRLDHITPDEVIKDTCVVDLKQFPKFWMTRVQPSP